MEAYHRLLEKIIAEGTEKTDRTGTGTYSIFGEQLKFDLSEGFPLMTTKKLHFKSILFELLWFLKGETNVRYLQENGVRIWNEWANEQGDLGPVYGKQWVSWKGYSGEVINQIEQAVDLINNQPDSRRILVSAWNVAELHQMALLPCHVLFQFYVAHGKLSCQLYQRSADVFLGVPFNIASYALLTLMIAHVTGLKPGIFVHTFGDVHLYKNHIDQAKIQLARKPGKLPEIRINQAVKSIFDFKYEDFELLGYNPEPNIPAKVAV